MANFMRESKYCFRCERWFSPIQHIKKWEPHGQCPVPGGEIQLDVDTFTERCTACGKQWKAEDLVFYCSCGNVQKTQYRDAAVAAQSGVVDIKYDGEVAHVWTRSGTVIVTQRKYLDLAVSRR